MKTALKHAEIIYSANRYGYVVHVVMGGEVIDEYHAGNCYGDSTSSIEPHSIGAAHPNTLRAWALQTAKDTADEYRLPYSKIIYEAGLMTDPEKES